MSHALPWICLVFDQNRFFTKTPEAETGHFKKPKFGQNRIFCRNSFFSAETALFLPRNLCFCQNRAVLAKRNLFQDKQANFATKNLFLPNLLG